MKQQPVNDHAEPPQPLLEHAAARVAFSMDARTISDFAAAMVPTNSDRYAMPGEYVTQARQLRKFTAFLVIRAVLLERARGSSWAEISGAMGEPESWVRATWGPAEQQWLADLAAKRDTAPVPQTVGQALMLPPSDAPLTEDDIRKVAGELDDWCARHFASADLPMVDNPDARRPVSDGIVER